jgi:FkbM family methyltransferase
MTINIDLLNDIAVHHAEHARESNWWKEANERYLGQFDEEFKKPTVSIKIGSGGEILIRNINFGSISTKHLFGLDELIIFAWYELNKKRYKRALDLGANIGLHSLIMDRLGFTVTSYEPDPVHIELFNELISTNSARNVSLREKAIGVKKEKLNFTRVLGNTTGNHLTGAKQNPYGDLEMFEVEVDALHDVLRETYSLVKMDVEGYEVKLIQALVLEDFENMDIMLEIGTAENATIIYDELIRIGVNAFSQKNNWKKVSAADDLPTSHREGSLFLTTASAMNWEHRE